MIDHDKLREALGHVHRVFANQGGCTVTVCADDLRILRAAAESTLPKTKMVEVWHVEYTVWTHENVWEPRVEVCGDKVIAEARAIHKRNINRQSAIRVTGPHLQEVPA